MIALKNFRYGGRAYVAGDEIQPWNDRDAAVLRKTRLAEDKTETVADIIEELEKPRRRYHRRDMRAGD
jgi:hypothetical protein